MNAADVIPGRAAHRMIKTAGDAHDDTDTERIFIGFNFLDFADRVRQTGGNVRPPSRHYHPGRAP